jgi:hypothetical protein
MFIEKILISFYCAGLVSIFAWSGNGQPFDVYLNTLKFYRIFFFSFFIFHFLLYFIFN